MKERFLKNRPKFKKAFALVSWILVISMILSLSVFAYFSYETNQEHSSFRMANVSIEAEASILTNPPSSQFNQNGHYLSLQDSTKGGDIPYNMTITNTSDGEAIMYTLVATPVYYPKETFTSYEEDVYSFLNKSTLNDNWTLIYAESMPTTEGRRVAYCYYGYLKPVQPGETIEGPFDSLTYNPASVQYNNDLYPVNQTTKYTYMPISVTAFGIQPQDHGFEPNPKADDEHDFIDIVPNSWDFVNYLVLNLYNLKENEQVYSYFLFQETYYDYIIKQKQ